MTTFITKTGIADILLKIASKIDPNTHTDHDFETDVDLNPEPELFWIFDPNPD